MGRNSSNPVILERLSKLKVSELMAHFRPNTRGTGTIGNFEAIVSFGVSDGTIELQSKEGKRQIRPFAK